MPIVKYYTSQGCLAQGFTVYSVVLTRTEIMWAIIGNTVKFAANSFIPLLDATKLSSAMDPSIFLK